MKRAMCAAILFLVLAILLTGCRVPKGSGVRLKLDGEVWNGDALPQAEGDLRVYVTLDGDALIDLPFSEAHVLEIEQADGARNVVRLTGEAVWMEDANCENHDCINMGEVNRDNLELRVMGGFIICLPHRISVEVRGE